MAGPDFHLLADVSSDDSPAIEPVLSQLVSGSITETTGGFHVEATMTGPTARDLNRSPASLQGLAQGQLEWQKIPHPSAIARPVQNSFRRASTTDERDCLDLHELADVPERGNAEKRAWCIVLREGSPHDVPDGYQVGAIA